MCKLTDFNNDPTCPKCTVPLEPGKAIENKEVSGVPDFPDSKPGDTGQTMSYSGRPLLVTVLKCPNCGYSVKK